MKEQRLMNRLPRGLRSDGFVHCSKCGHKQEFVITIQSAKIVVAQPVFDRKGEVKGFIPEFKPRQVA